MNYRLYDGTVRCADHMDASSYQGTTSEPCAYCPESTLDVVASKNALPINRYRVLFAHPGQPTAGILFSVDAPNPGHAQDLCNDAVREEGGLLDGCVFTIWPDPVPVS